MHYTQYRKIRIKISLLLCNTHTHTHTQVGVPALYALYMQITGIVLRDYSGISNFHYVLFKWTSKFCEYVEPIAARRLSRETNIR